MLTNNNPFVGSNKDKTLKNISAMDEGQLSQHYDHLNKDARDLLRALLQKELKRRPSIMEVLRFRWLYMKPLVTTYISPIRKHTKKGSGFVEVLSDQRVVYSKGTFRMEVSKDGQIIHVSENGEQSEYTLLELPPVHNGTYKFLSDFCESIRSKTRIIELTDYLNDISLVIMANNSVKVVDKDRTLLTYKKGEFITSFARYKITEKTKEGIFPQFPSMLGTKPGFRVIHSMWDAVKNEVVLPEDAPLILEWDNSSGTTSFVASSLTVCTVGGGSSSHGEVTTMSTPGPTHSSLMNSMNRKLFRTVSDSKSCSESKEEFVCSTLISTNVPVDVASTSSRSRETKQTVKKTVVRGQSHHDVSPHRVLHQSHQEVSQFIEPDAPTLTITKQMPLVMSSGELCETTKPHITTGQVFLPDDLIHPCYQTEKSSDSTDQVAALSLQTCSSKTSFFLPEKGSTLHATQSSAVVESLHDKVPCLAKDVFSLGSANVPEAVQAPEEKLGLVLSGYTEPVSCTPVLSSKLSSVTPASTVQPSNPPETSTYQQELQGDCSVFKRVFSHGGIDTTFWPTTGIFREIDPFTGTTKWMIPRPYAVWIETTDCITVDTEKGRFSWDPRQIQDPEKDFPYWEELRDILDTISRMMVE